MSSLGLSFPIFKRKGLNPSIYYIYVLLCLVVCCSQPKKRREAHKAELQAVLSPAPVVLTFYGRAGTQ